MPPRPLALAAALLAVATACTLHGPEAGSPSSGEQTAPASAARPAADAPPPSLADALSPASAALVDVDLQARLARAPNVVVVLLDDVGFGAAEPFGGPIPTPTLERLAGDGLRYNRFHTTAICSPTRAALLTGRNAHAVGVGAVLNSATDHPGKRGVLDPATPTLADHLRARGYATAAFGKWHLTPDWETSPAGPFDQWPTRRGFDRFYGFLGGETHQFEPTLYEGTRSVRRPPGDDYHLTEDLAEQAASWMRLQHSLRPDRPFFVYFATGATHAPIHAPASWIRRFRGQFDHGWDVQRERTFARQKRAGVIPADAKLTPRPDTLPAWDALSPDERRVAARLMEAEAAFLAHTDAQIGALVAALEESGELDDTLFIYIVGDNGASAEGGVLGAWNYFAGIHGLPENTARDLERLDAIGGPKSYPHYPAGWAWALNTPFQWAKTIASHLGGTRNPMVIHWPARLGRPGGIRSQFSHVNDLTPTILEAVDARLAAAQGAAGGRDAGGTPIAGGAPRARRTRADPPAPRFDGTSLVYTFDAPDAPSRHRTQYFEVFGHRAIYHDGWMASAFRGRAPWRVLDPITRPLDADRWELYDLDSDFSQAVDLARQEPRRLRALQAVFEREAAANRVLPIGADIPGQGLPALHQDRRHFVFHAGSVGIPENGAPPIPNRSWAIRAELDVPRGGAHGVVATEGGGVAGWALYLDDRGRPAYHYDFFDVERMTIVGRDPVPSGRQRLRFVFDADPGIGAGGRGRLYVGERLVGEGRIARTAPRFFSIDETFDIGTDSGSPAGDYPAGWDFTGRILSVEIDVASPGDSTAATEPRAPQTSRGLPVATEARSAPSPPP
ncbi:MAG: arylsulfatase [Myxococcota bacterium]